MRRFTRSSTLLRSLITVAVGSVFALAAGCGFDSTPSSGDPAGGTSTATAADILAATNAACNQAVSMSSDNAAGFNRDITRFGEAAANGLEVDQAGIDNFEAQMRGWSATLSSLATGPVDPELRTALTESAAAIEAAAGAAEAPLTEEQIAAVSEVPEKLRAVCE
ncbi:hypothetical protein O7632_27450 [Solwaraspora sp. WMMD406]|uniref:hypothetical protein n=1 Tax=Solwaraspora sp. WMMD406 TaxID=3016095 RepID=UPI0024168FCE|nr:hypothetical protein [Solwaraspora sp. WMMD406]MDG4767801.1 hypothetical protein [Solwaraspora sp. WMMD406]